GERDEHFRELCDFVKSQKFDRIGVFKFSDENSALSYGLDAKVDENVIEERYHALNLLQQKVSLQKNRTFIGKTIDVLLESEEPGAMIGRGERDAPDVDGNVLVKMSPRERRHHQPGEFVKVRVSGCTEYDLSGKLA
ncbi:MAG TPA: TRAM domain-containing protein, partial [Abditibacterium sp.]